jgi:hypothetical protein|tara:strand:- start:4798 stop:7173 length:2376 start_codon:yes stop_codon:yes gene_type:complete
MYLGSNKIPQQKLNLSKKTKKWREACVEAYIDLSTAGYSERRDWLKTLYDYYNGVIDEVDYRYVLKPYGKTRQNFPSKMRNYPIIKPIIDLLLGEKSKRPLNYTVTVQNSDAITIKEEAKKELLYKNLEQQFINKMNEAGQQTGVPSQEVEMPQHISQMFENNYTDIRAIKGQQAMSFIMQHQEIYDKLQKAWFHFLVSGEVYTWRGVRSSEPFYEILNPLDIDYDKDPDVEFVEDGDWALIRKYVHASTIIDHYRDFLDDSQILRLEEPENASMDSYLTVSSRADDREMYRERLIEVVTVYWKSRKKVGFLNYLDPQTGSWEERIVDEKFRMPAELKQMGATVDWQWINEVWEGTRIDGNLYVKIEPCTNQRASMDNPSKCKLPINGRKYSDLNTKNISLVSLGIPYQLNYNIYKYRLELAIAKSKDIIAQFDINMIPKKWDMDKFMYYVEGTGIAWVDYNKEGIQLSPQHQGVLDLSIKTIEQYIALLDSIMIEWEKVSGVNRQRQGQVGNYEGKATSQQAIVQSSHITEDIFRKFSRLEQRDMQALLDYSKEAWLTGKKGMYVMSDGTKELFDLDSLKHMESEYGIFVSDSGQDQDKLEILKQLAQSMVQNGVPASTIAEMVDADNFSEIKEKIKSAESAQQQLAQAQQQAEAEQAEAQRELTRDTMENENEQNEKDRETKIRIALIAAEAKLRDNQFNADKSQQDAQIKSRQTDLKAEDSMEKSRSNQAKEDLIREDQRLKAEQAGVSAIQHDEDREQAKEDKEKDREIKKEDQVIKKQAAQKPKSE